MEDRTGIMDKFHVRSFSLHQSACNGSEASQPSIQLVVSLTPWWKVAVEWSWSFTSILGQGSELNGAVFITTNKRTINITTVSLYIIYTPTCFDISMSLSSSFIFVSCQVT
jgi:hypothetical protein